MYPWKQDFKFIIYPNTSINISPQGIENLLFIIRYIIIGTLLLKQLTLITKITKIISGKSSNI
jgi:hypothetical protein